MASIIGGIGTSHVPTIGVAYDKGKQQDPLWKPLFDGYTPVANWLAEQQPDVLVFFYNDHCTTFFFDLTRPSHWASVSVSRLPMKAPACGTCRPSGATSSCRPTSPNAWSMTNSI